MKLSSLICILLFGLNAFAQQEKMPTQKSTTVTSEKVLRPRDHNISVQYSALKFDVELDTGVESESKTGELSFSYARNFGHYAFGVGISANLTDNGSSESKSRTLDLMARWNFVENKPGQDWIPFATVDLLRYSEKFETSTSDIDTDGNLFGLSVGLTWYPFSELFAFELAYGRFSGELDYDSNSVNGDLDAVVSGISLSSVLSF